MAQGAGGSAGGQGGAAGGGPRAAGSDVSAARATRMTWRRRLAAPFVATYRLVRPIGRAFWHRGKAGRVVLGGLVAFVVATWWYTGSWGMAIVAFGFAVLTAPVLLLDLREQPLASFGMTLELLPAVDVADGQAVRLVQGVAGTETAYGDPVKAALAWQDAGAEWVHLVDLDAAFGRGSNRELLAEVVGRLDVDVELSGGIRDDESLHAAMATGCRRVNIGTAALENPEWCARAIAEYGDRVAIGLDVRGTTLAARGWTQDGGDLWEVLERLDRDGCARYVVTDVAKDGMLKGPNLDLLRDVCARTDKPGRRVRRGLVPRRPPSHRRADRRRRRGRHRRQGALRRRLHPARGARGGPPMSDVTRLGSGSPL